MNIKIFAVIYDNENKYFDTEEFDKFCMNKRIYSYKSQYIYDGENHIWSIVVEYDNITGKTGKTTIKLSESEKKLYDILREWRKNEGEKSGAPVYIIANNKELETIVINRPKTLSELSGIDGFGKKKIENYGKEIIEIIKNFYGDEK